MRLKQHVTLVAGDVAMQEPAMATKGGISTSAPCAAIESPGNRSAGAALGACKPRLQWMAAALGATCIAASAQGTPASQIVTIGFAGPISGSMAHFGKDGENAVRMAVDELNDRKMIIGGKRAVFKVMAEDDVGDPRQGTAVAQKFCDARVNGVVGHINSGTSIPASRVYADCGLPHISPGSTNPKLTQAGYKTTFRIIANDDQLGVAMADYAANQLKLKRIAMVDDRTAFGQGLAAVFRAQALKDGIEIVADEFTTDKATDFSSILTAIKAKKPQAIFIGAGHAQAGPMLRQMESLGMRDVRMLGGDAICTEQLAELSDKAATLDNVVCAVGGSSIAHMNGGTAWKKRYDEHFPHQYSLFSPYAYDATMVLADAMKRADSTDPIVYAPKLFDAHYTGLTGTVEFDSKGELTKPTVTMYTYRKGEKVALD
ncbi:MAG: amino acid/amide transporter substrate-binding protein family [Rhizobacter sp.]|nr:amino acid/amide transporter substrate-binding protein family [Rhizobacter sp.]